MVVVFFAAVKSTYPSIFETAFLRCIEKIKFFSEINRIFCHLLLIYSLHTFTFPKTEISKKNKKLNEL